MTHCSCGWWACLTGEAHGYCVVAGVGFSFFTHWRVRRLQLFHRRHLSYILSLFLDCSPVVDRRLLTFLVSPRKRKQKKATALHCPSGSRLCKSKNGKCPQLAALRQGHFYIHFLPRTTGSSEAEFLSSKTTAKFHTYSVSFTQYFKLNNWSNQVKSSEHASTITIN